MRVKVYFVVRDKPGGGQELFAARLTQFAADRIAQTIPGAYTRRWVATKDIDLSFEDEEAQGRGHRRVG